MPFAVAKWPSQSDPRTSIFGGPGWAFGSVVSWAWIMSTTAATGPWTRYNSGVLVKSTVDIFTETQWSGFGSHPPTTATVTRKSTQPTIIPPDSIELTVDVVSIPPGREAAASQRYVYPFAVAVFDGFVMIDDATGLPDVDFPNPVKITPAIWNL